MSNRGEAFIVYGTYDDYVNRNCIEKITKDNDDLLRRVFYENDLDWENMAKDNLNCLFGSNNSKIKKIITNDNAVIVFWEDGDKTVVKKMDGDNDDVYSAVAQALAKKIYGSTNHFHKIVDETHTVQKERTKYHGE